MIGYAWPLVLPVAAFVRDGDFDISGDGIVDFVGDVIRETKLALMPGLWK